jgi:hypothetical protein
MNFPHNFPRKNVPKIGFRVARLFLVQHIKTVKNITKDHKKLKLLQLKIAKLAKLTNPIGQIYTGERV